MENIITLKEFADFKSLNKLPKVELVYDYKYKKNGNDGLVSVTIKNPSKSLAFFIFLDLVDSISEEPILPIFWNDNYVHLLPGEERTYKATYSLSQTKEKPILKVKALNVKTITLK